MKKIAVYGAGNYGRSVMKLIRNRKEIQILLVCDSDPKKWGMDYEGFSVEPPECIFEKEELEGVFIAIREKNDVEAFILQKRIVSIYRKIEELVPTIIYWDISGKCNAKCKYCVTGRNNRKRYSKNTENSYLDISGFKRNYRHLYEHGIVSKESNLCLFNWKEPFLNPDLMDILAYCSAEGQRYSLSTNGSVVREAIDKNTFSRCDAIYFSMPGFSQESYDRIHGFRFTIIKNNILKIKQNMLEHGFCGKFIINAHIYRFSEREMGALQEWAEKEGLLVNAYYPYLAGNSLIKDYLENRLSDWEKDEISSDLYLHWDREISNAEREGFMNPLCFQMTFDEKGRLTLCCAADEYCEQFDCWGKIEDLNSYEDYLNIKEEMLNSKTCVQCRQYNMAYRILNNEA